MLHSYAPELCENELFMQFAVNRTIEEISNMLPPESMALLRQSWIGSIRRKERKIKMKRIKWNDDWIFLKPGENPMMAAISGGGAAGK